MVKYLKIKDIKPADYNPRKISEEQIEELKKSFKEIGFIIPILVNKKNNVIIAGHQRTKTAEMIGFKELPAMLVDDIVLGDEIKFNQIHNSIDKSLNNSPNLLKEYPKEKFIEIENSDIENKDAMSVIVKEICKLILKYGNVLSCVICRNKVVYGCEYVKACKLLNLKINAYICNDEKYNKLIYFLNKEYGKYYYDEIKRDTFVQGLAQMFRTVEKNKEKLNGRDNKSSLYEKMVLPYLYNNDVKTVLDFGCGKGAYINSLKLKYNAIGVEFYNNNRKSINVTLGNKQIDELIEYLKVNKTFDVVVCDSVLNSVDSVKAENSVLAFLNLMASNKLFISGRRLESAISRVSARKDVSNELNYLEYLDGNNFTANYREGKWYFQHFHSKETIKKLLEKFGFKVIKYTINHGTSFQVECEKVRSLSKQEYIDAIDFEFNLPLPNNKSYNRNKEVKEVLGLC